MSSRSSKAREPAAVPANASVQPAGELAAAGRRWPRWCRLPRTAAEWLAAVSTAGVITGGCLSLAWRGSASYQEKLDRPELAAAQAKADVIHDEHTREIAAGVAKDAAQDAEIAALKEGQRWTMNTLYFIAVDRGIGPDRVPPPPIP